MKLQLNNLQLERVSEIFGNLGLLFFATTVVPLFTNRQSVNLQDFLTGLGLGIDFIVMSIVILKK